MPKVKLDNHHIGAFAHKQTSRKPDGQMPLAVNANCIRPVPADSKNSTLDRINADRHPKSRLASLIQNGDFTRPV